MKGEDRRAARVRLEHRYPVNLMGVDGTWRRACFLLDVSDTGAKIEVEGSIDVLKAREFFLVLSSTGLAFRRCELNYSATKGRFLQPITSSKAGGLIGNRQRRF